MEAISLCNFKYLGFSVVIQNFCRLIVSFISGSSRKTKIFKCTISCFIDQGDDNGDFSLVCLSFGCVPGVSCNLTDVIASEKGIQAFAVIRKVSITAWSKDAELMYSSRRCHLISFSSSPVCSVQGFRVTIERADAEPRRSKHI